ncbi:DEAD/DEAH box helicase [Desulfobotulus mexicanus]|uniref:DEAD/DEAH box helicase n=1 Tax=Desulfobotulus mexicanus TaxID=2586642 RepID=A0A5Q4VJ53_9BACT|nr:DEAD/DEAH box helicase [Desulfobotulus mexicanus]TYT76237.1 DEAD/DEAH box helicase [Desulfobotulus mexicanus]
MQTTSFSTGNTNSLPILRLSRDLEVLRLPEQLKEDLCRTLRMENPKWLENQRMGRWNGNTAKHLFFYTEEKEGSLRIPRGFTRSLMLMLRSHNLSWELEDQRLCLPEVEFNFTGTLKDFQKQAVSAMAAKEFGTLNAPTGAGKTVMALALVAARKQPALIVVHTRELALQWASRIEQFLGIPKDLIGMIGGGKNRTGEKITVALVQSLVKNKEEISPHIGHIIVDECHRTPSKTFTDAVSAFPARYSLGLSATLFRRDNLARLIFWYLGDVHHAVDSRKLVRNGDILAAEVHFRKTDFKPFHDPVTAYAKMMKELITDKDRNHLIAEDVARQCRIHGDGVMLVLSDRRQHCEILHGLLRYGHKIQASLLTGDLKAAERKEVMEDLDAGEVQVLVATGQLIGEGFDCRDLSTLFLATPIRFSGRLLQYLGRILRPSDEKKTARVFDYVDINVDVLTSMARHRLRVYGENQNKDEWNRLFPEDYS